MARDTTTMLAIDTGGTKRATMTMSEHRLYGNGHDYNVGTATTSSHDNDVLTQDVGHHDNDVLTQEVRRPP